jgi:hypothetical protein
VSESDEELPLDNRLPEMPRNLLAGITDPIRRQRIRSDWIANQRHIARTHTEAVQYEAEKKAEMDRLVKAAKEARSLEWVARTKLFKENMEDPTVDFDFSMSILPPDQIRDADGRTCKLLPKQKRPILKAAANEKRKKDEEERQEWVKKKYNRGSAPLDPSGSKGGLMFHYF